MKKELGKDRPWVSISFVAMADNIQELPQFVELAGKLGAGRVFVEDLSGWDGRDSENKPASENPGWLDYAEQARRLGSELGIALQLPQRFMPELKPDSSARHACCSWIQGVSVNRDGGIGPCCMIHGTVDMGNILDGPLMQNEKYAKIKELLLGGRVLPQCAKQANCIYVQQQKAAGIPLRIVPAREVGCA
jgi:MoaA/NifB/PqqE/SkfB family radical SAM enzyme